MRVVFDDVIYSGIELMVCRRNGSDAPSLECPYRHVGAPADRECPGSSTGSRDDYLSIDVYDTRSCDKSWSQ